MRETLNRHCPGIVVVSLGLWVMAQWTCMAFGSVSMDDATTLYLPFDDDLKPSGATPVETAIAGRLGLSQPNNQGKPRAVAGRSLEILDSGASYTIPTAGVVPADRGTIEFFWRWETGAGVTYNVPMYIETPALRCERGDVLYFERTGFRWNAGLGRQARIMQEYFCLFGQWHHVALTWQTFSSGETLFELFVDGDFCDRKIERLQGAAPFGDRLTLVSNKRGMYDELRIRRVVRSDAEIAQAAKASGFRRLEWPWDEIEYDTARLNELLEAMKTRPVAVLREAGLETTRTVRLLRELGLTNARVVNAADLARPDGLSWAACLLVPDTLDVPAAEAVGPGLRRFVGSGRGVISIARGGLFLKAVGLLPGLKPYSLRQRSLMAMRSCSGPIYSTALKTLKTNWFPSTEHLTSWRFDPNHALTAGGTTAGPEELVRDNPLYFVLPYGKGRVAVYTFNLPEDDAYFTCRWLRPVSRHLSRLLVRNLIFAAAGVLPDVAPGPAPTAAPPAAVVAAARPDPPARQTPAGRAWDLDFRAGDWPQTWAAAGGWRPREGDVHGIAPGPVFSVGYPKGGSPDRGTLALTLDLKARLARDHETPTDRSLLCVTAGDTEGLCLRYREEWGGLELAWYSDHGHSIVGWYDVSLDAGAVCSARVDWQRAVASERVLLRLFVNGELVASGAGHPIRSQPDRVFVGADANGCGVASAVRRFAVADHAGFEPAEEVREALRPLVLAESHGDALRGLLKRGRIAYFSPHTDAPVMAKEGYECHPITETQILAGDLDLARYPVVVFWGGPDWLKLMAKPEACTERVKDFVRAGGGFVGFCGGMNYALDTKMIEAPVTATGNVGQHLMSFSPDHPITRETVPPDARTGRRLCPVMRWNGWWIKGQPPAGVTAFGWIEDVPGRPATMIEAALGRGRVVVSGAHPECGDEMVVPNDRQVNRDLLRAMILFAGGALGAAEPPATR